MQPMNGAQFSLRLVWLFCAAFLVALPPVLGSDWPSKAIWYQIFPERFANGDPNNDPTMDTLEGTWPYDRQEAWSVVPWTSDWYQAQPWERANGRGFYYNAQLRRYGGDLQGILDKLDYLQELGVNALYLNPIFESPSLHKYGAVLYHHVDNHFGPDPAGDAELWKREDPANPATWQWSAADRLFLKLIEQVHARGMRIIIDGVFNHAGIRFWAMERARREGPESRYAKWFTITQWDDPTTPEDEFRYKGWFGIKDLPEFWRDEQGLHPEVKAHFRHILRRWMDPNGDGDPSDGIDGWRLDVADQVPLAFWKEFRGWVKAMNPEAYLTGEVWWEDYRNFKFHNARPWLEDAFDGVMNYRFADALFRFFNPREPIPASELSALLNAMHREYGYSSSLKLQNLLGSHDTSRIGSVVVNPEHRLDHGANLDQNPRYQVRKPNPEEIQTLKLIVAFQFLAPGAPYIYYGDEAGMWGADDPDCRKPMVWPEFKYDVERSHPLGLERPADPVEVNHDLLQFYRKLIGLRSRSEALSRGDYQVLLADDERRLFAFRRSWSGEEWVAVFNAATSPANLAPRELAADFDAGFEFVFGLPGEGRVKLEARTFALLKKRQR